MPDLSFGLLDLVSDGLEKHKDKLGPLHRPLVLLLGAILFVVFLALLIGAPILWMEDFVYIAVLQVCLIAAFFMLLLTIPLNVYDRFVFCMALFLILAAAPIMVTVSFFLGNLIPEDPAAFKDAISAAKPEIFMYALLRGLGQMAWSLPLLFLFFTFFPRIKGKGAKYLASRLQLTVWSAVVLHTLAASLQLWLGSTSKVFKSVEAAAPALGAEIHQYQMGFLLFQSLYLLLGYATIFAARHWYKGDDNRWLGLVVAGMVTVQGCYMVSSYNNRELDFRYPAARTTGNYIETWKARGKDQFVFSIPRPNTISASKFGAFKTYAVCDVPESFKFSFRVTSSSGFPDRFAKSARANVPADQMFCQPQVN